MAQKLNLPKRVYLTELLARDGFQAEKRFIPTETKVYFINAAARAGFSVVEVTNFTHPARVPQHRDAEEVLRRIERVPGVEYKCYAMTDKAFERACRAKEAGYGPDIVAFTISASEAHLLRNGNRTLKEFLAQIPNWVRMCHSVGMKINMAIATAFGCPIAGPVPPRATYELIERGLEMGVDEATRCDTTGEATPDRVYEFYMGLRERFPTANVHMAHFHDARGMAMANYLAAMMAGVDRLETSLGELGGQPAFIVDGVPGLGTGPSYTPSTIIGNASTEDLVVMLDEMGIETGVDVDRVLELGRILEWVLERDLRPRTTKTGRIPKGRTNWGAIPPYAHTYWAWPQEPVREKAEPAAQEVAMVR